MDYVSTIVNILNNNYLHKKITFFFIWTNMQNSPRFVFHLFIIILFVSISVFVI